MQSKIEHFSLGKGVFVSFSLDDVGDAYSVLCRSEQESRPWFIEAPGGHGRVRLNGGRFKVPLTGVHAWFWWCIHNWLEVIFLSEIDSQGFALVKFVVDNDEMRLSPVYDHVLFDVSFVDIGLGKLVIDTLRSKPVEYCGCRGLYELDGEDDFDAGDAQGAVGLDEIDDDDEIEEENEQEEGGVAVRILTQRNEIRRQFRPSAVVAWRYGNLRHSMVVQGGLFHAFLITPDRVCEFVLFCYPVHYLQLFVCCFLDQNV